MVMVNLPTAGVDYHVPFGGTRKSSYGAREQGFAAVEYLYPDEDRLHWGLKWLADIGRFARASIRACAAKKC